MEELVEILINLVASFFQNKSKTPPSTFSPPRSTPPAVPQRSVSNQPPAIQPQRVAAQRQVAPPKKPPQRRGIRRPAPPMIAMSQPIMTGVPSGPVETPAVVPMTRTISHSINAIASNQGIADPKASFNQSATALRKWLTPTTLKNQFLLTEILQPPLALRDNHHLGR